jgi:hypothetical protein
MCNDRSKSAARPGVSVRYASALLGARFASAAAGRSVRSVRVGPAQSGSRSTASLACPRSGAYLNTVIPSALAPLSSWLPPSPTNAHSEASTPTALTAIMYASGCGLRTPVLHENEVTSTYRAIGLSTHTSGVSAEQSLTTPTLMSAVRSAASAGSAQVRLCSPRVSASLRWTATSSA